MIRLAAKLGSFLETCRLIGPAQAVMNDLEAKIRPPEGKVSTRMLRTQRVLQDGSQP